MIRILDCTLRDGGYYTNWDFSKPIVKQYINAFNKLPVEFVEVGYRSPGMEGYHGEFFYSPIRTLEQIKLHCNKKIAILINEKEVNATNIYELLNPCKGLVDLIRLAVNPARIKSACSIAEHVKKMGFQVAFNVMYLSQWEEHEQLFKTLPSIGEVVDVFYLVDSYGSIFPENLKNSISKIKSITDVSLGFHGHNNLEMALSNTLQAIDSGVEIVDATVTGMGRGAGNLKTELLLAVLNKQSKLDLDFDALSQVTEVFEDLKKDYNWGTALPYMVSGVNSLPQKNVMSLVQKKIYSLNTIINTLRGDHSKSSNFKQFSADKNYKTAVIIGGGPTAGLHAEAINQFVEKYKDSTCLIHSSSKNANHYQDANAEQYFCLLGNEGYRLKSVFNNFLNQFKGQCILPPKNNTKGTFIPDKVRSNTYQIEAINFSSISEDSHLALAIQIAINLKVERIFFVGYDGYNHQNIAPKDLKFFKENSLIFDDLKETSVVFSSLTPTLYEALHTSSVYKFI